MKNRIIALGGIILLLVFASACNSYRNVTVLKRHYSKGNYISVNKNHKSFVNHKLKSDKFQSIENAAKPINISVDNINEELNTEASAAKSVQSNTIKSVTNFSELVNSAERNKIAERERNENIPKLSSLKKGISKLHMLNAQKDDEARSLFWLVITVLVIIWLIALVSGGWGLGGFVNLLLLIALILFILWLLRLI